MMQEYRNDGGPSDNTWHGTPHPYTPTCEERPKCRDIIQPIPAPTPEPEPPPRASMLREAETLICGDRNNQYGPPTQDFQRTADLLNALGYARVDAESEIHDILASDVALIIAQVKISRIMHSRHKRDSWVDLAGYAACGYECATEESAE